MITIDFHETIAKLTVYADANFGHRKSTSFGLIIKISQIFGALYYIKSVLFLIPQIWEIYLDMHKTKVLR